MSEEQKFRVGDLVRAFGCDGVVINTNSDEVGDHFPVVAQLTDQTIYRDFFTSDGKYKLWHKEPSLVLIERPKKMIKEKVWVVLAESKLATLLSVDNKWTEVEVEIKE